MKMPLLLSLKKFFLKVLKIVIFCFIVGFFVFLINFFYEYTKIKELKIINVEKEEIIGLENLKNKSLVFLNLEETKKILLNKNPFIKEIDLEKKIPNILIIKVIFDQPIAVLSSDNGYFYLSSEGKILEKIKDLKKAYFPKINFYQKLFFNSYSLGDKIEFKEILFGLQILKMLTDLKIKVNSLDINSVNVLLFNLENKKVYFSSEKEIGAQFYQFEKIYRQFKIEGRNYQEIDLRFDKPIVRF